ncbi:Solvent efflux pump periplasmic linker SrpA [Arenibacter antarcticus]|uniref:Efflux RND transporter periplasmic adaptor subunit n=1 Tax=Arenibacter antarcticus TaxID=2040469 RepID=A0ABW5VHV2_9FLAO|nr:efflux RND transporter periplasmic adaptor subunit [Arenibacter sp. H213]MCM4166662.1 efflux RND transporter periplasmic adaptor subunit [Arenibacter sp. H213]
MKRFLLIPVALTITLFIGCGEKAPSGQATSATPYPTIKVEKRTVDNFTKFPASIEGLVNSKVRAKVAGYIQEVLVDAGQQVRKGQLLFTLETQSLSQDAGAAKARINSAQVEVDKLRPLVEKNIISSVQLATANANLEQAKSNYQSIVANIDYAQIKSPVNGVVGSIPFRKGNLISAQDAVPLTTISSIEQVYAFFSMNEKDLLGFLREVEGNSMNEKAQNMPEVQLILADGSVYEHKGKIETISGEVNPNTGTVSFRATFPNPKGLLRNGSSGSIILPNKMKDVLVVPTLSTYEQQGNNFVYLVQGDTLVPKSITVKAAVNGLSVIEGLEEGVQLLANGLGKARPGLQIIPQPTSLDSILNSYNSVFK